MEEPYADEYDGDPETWRPTPNFGMMCPVLPEDDNDNDDDDDEEETEDEEVKKGSKEKGKETEQLEEDDASQAGSAAGSDHDSNVEYEAGFFIFTYWTNTG